MEEKPKILIVHNHYRIRGGEDTVVQNERKLLESHGHKVLLYERDNSEISDFSIINKLLLPFTSIYNPRTVRDIKRIIKRDHVDIVHVHNTLALISPSVYYATVSSGIPVVQTVHNFRFVCANALLYRNGRICEDCLNKGSGCAVRYGCYRNSRLQTLTCVIGMKLHRLTGIFKKISLIFLSEFNREKILSINRKKECFDRKKTYVKPNFVPGSSETEKDRPDPGEHREGFIYVGRPEEIKGTRTLIEAWRIMGKNAPRLTIVGTGELEEWCRLAIREHSLNIEMSGYLKHPEVMDRIRRSKALILPTLLYEGNPMSVIEGLNAGIPVIVSDIGNAAALIEEGINGIHFKTGSPESLVRAVEQLDERMKGHQDIRMPDIYRPEENYNALMNIYQSVLGSKG